MSFRIGKALILRGREFSVSGISVKGRLTIGGLETRRKVDPLYLHLSALKLIRVDNTSVPNSIEIPIIPKKDWHLAGMRVFREEKDSLNQYKDALNKIKESDDSTMLTGFALKILESRKERYGLIRSGSVLGVFDFCQRWSYGGDKSFSNLAEPRELEDFLKKLSEEFPLVIKRERDITVGIKSAIYGAKKTIEHLRNH